LASSLVGLLLPQNLEMVETVSQPALFGEIAIMLWLIIMGARKKPVAIAP